MEAPVVKKRGVGRPPGSKNRAAKGKLDSKPGATNRKLGRMQVVKLQSNFSIAVAIHAHYTPFQRHAQGTRSVTVSECSRS